MSEIDDEELIDAFHCAETAYLSALYSASLWQVTRGQFNDLLVERDKAWAALSDRFRDLRNHSKSPKKKRDAAERVNA